MCVFGDDHVTCYMGVEVDAGEHVDTKSRSGASYESFMLFFLNGFYGLFCIGHHEPFIIFPRFWENT